MRKLAFLLLAALALPTFAASYGSIVIRDGDRHYSHGDSRDLAATASLGERFAFFERDGIAYVIRDSRTIASIREIVKPQEELGRQQAELGAEQAALGAKQAALGAKQAALGAQEAVSTSSARSKELGAQQRELARQQEKLAAQQEPLAEQQRVLGEKQHEASKITRRALERLFEEAIRNGVATRR